MKKSFYLDDSRHSIDWAPQSIDWIAHSFAKDQVSPKQGMTTPALYDYENFYRTHGNSIGLVE